MKAFEREDRQFVEHGVDALQRETAIGHLVRKRRILFWCALVATLCAVCTMMIGRGSAAGAGLGFAAAIHWMLVFKYESELRLLMMIRRLRSL